jgi:hypothetical protein
MIIDQKRTFETIDIQNQNRKKLKMNNLVTLFQAYALETKPPIIELQNINHDPVAALYLEKINYTNIAISETNNIEKYFLYIDGVGIYFSYFKKISA